MVEGPAHKRPRLDLDHAGKIRAQRSEFLSSLSRDVSPPRNGRQSATTFGSSFKAPLNSARDASDSAGAAVNEKVKNAPKSSSSPFNSSPSLNKTISSPFKLTRVTGLPPEDNIDTISLHDILGDPLIREAWIFNFCFDVNWTMQHFDEDVRQLINVKIVHGSWRKEDGNRIGIERDLKHWKNVQAIQAYLPDQFGTHHSKMIILFKHDDTARVIIHTANMLQKDWEHMTQAVWQSPALSLSTILSTQDAPDSPGGGGRFKHDLLRYVKAYGAKLKALAEQLDKYDFSPIRAALVASVPSYIKISDQADKKWGHLALGDTLQALPKATSKLSSQNISHLVCQISSIATLPATWLSETIFKAATTSTQSPTTSIVYPTSSDLRNALTGYATGGSIHAKIESAAQQKQVAHLRPQLNRWGAQSSNKSTRAGRHLIPPHIKTYICFHSKPTASDPAPDIDWMLVTSANLSQQAWGTAAKTPKGVRDPSQAVSHISSFEIGVLVWPDLFLEEADGHSSHTARMVPTFGKDEPEVPNMLANEGDDVVIGIRMPYDLPLTPYGPDEMPWSPQAVHTQPDRLGQTWT